MGLCYTCVDQSTVEVIEQVILENLHAHPGSTAAYLCAGFLGLYEMQGMLQYAEKAHACALALQCGRFSRFAEPGFNCIWCCVGAGPGLNQCAQAPNCPPLNGQDSCAVISSH